MPADEQDFFTRLKRARRKTEYLLIQAQTLVRTRVPAHAKAALHLLDLLLTQHSDPFHLSNAHLARAEALVALGRLPEAVDAFRAALQARREMPNVVNYAYLEYAWTIARLRAREHYEEVLACMQEFLESSDPAFPVNAYRYFGALALIADDLQDSAEARHQAMQAISAASVKKGPFSRHPDFGTLNPDDIDVENHRRLWRLAVQ
jgi:tetratricopeptide (TPR) repeat protein